MPQLLFGLRFRSRATTFLDKMPSGELRARLSKKARALISNPHPNGCEKLTNVTMEDLDVWRIRVGDYRILYAVTPAEVIVMDIAHRREVYRR